MRNWHGIGAVTFGLAAVLALGVLARADEKAGKEDKAPLTDEEFAKKAAQINLVELKAAKLAEKTTASPNVRGFSQGIQRDHLKAQKSLKDAVGTEVKFPMEVEKKDQKELDRLEDLKGKAFDRAYMAFVQKCHREAIVLYEKQAERGTNRELRRYAQETLKVLKTHQEEAKKTAKSIDD